MYNALLLQAQVSKIINITAGGLASALTASEKTTVTNLTVTGTIDARDFKIMRDGMPILAVLDLSGVTISAYSGTEGTLTGLTPYESNLIPHNAFRNQALDVGKVSLTSVTLPSSATAIGFSAFSKCSGLTSVVISQSVNYILSSAFWGCTGLTTVAIPSSVTTIQDGAFAHCSGLTLISIPSSITSIESTVFSFCTGLKSVNIPSSVTAIGVSAFFGCSGLTSLTIPLSVNSIGSWAFNGCTGLSSITAEWFTPLNISSSSDVFGQVNKISCKLNVPSGSITAYQQANQWRDFANIITEVQVINSEKISLYPNPVTDGFRISGIKRMSTISVFDINGKLLLTKVIDRDEYISVSSLPQGVYMVKISSEAGILEKKIVKE